MPNIHPFLVHFPVALLTISVLADLLAIVAKTPPWHGFAWRIQIVGTGFLLLAIATGLQAETTVFISEGAYETFELHKQLAFGGLTAFMGVFLWRAAKRGVLPERQVTVFMTIEILAMILVLLTAWFGGELVFTYGVGVK